MKISQREARRMRKELNALRERDSRRLLAWSSEYPGGVNVDTITVNDCEWHIVSTVQKLGGYCLVKASQNGNKQLLVYAITSPSMKEG